MKKKLMACEALLLPTLALTGCGSQFGDKMVRAGMNTLMGMGTVFVVLIFIAFLISRFKYISQLENWFRNHVIACFNPRNLFGRNCIYNISALFHKAHIAVTVRL